LSALVKGGFFDIDLIPPNILVVPTKGQSKFMMRHKEKEQVEEGNLLPK